MKVTVSEQGSIRTRLSSVR